MVHQPKPVLRIPFQTPVIVTELDDHGISRFTRGRVVGVTREQTPHYDVMTADGRVILGLPPERVREAIECRESFAVVQMGGRR